MRTWGVLGEKEGRGNHDPPVPVPLLVTLTATLTFLLSTTPAQAATGCSFVAPTATVTIEPNVSATLKRSGPAIQLNGVNCGAATVTNTDKIVVTGANGAETLTLDLSGGPFTPGAGSEATGAAEIEIELGLGTQGAFVQDKLVIRERAMGTPIGSGVPAST